MPPRANNYGPNMHPPPAFAQGGMQHVGHNLLERERYADQAAPARRIAAYSTSFQQQQQQHHANPQHNHHQQLYAAQHQAVRTSQQQQQEKNLLSILSQQQRGVGASMNGGVSASGLGGVVTRSIGVDPRAQMVAAAAQQQAAQAAVSGEGVIRDVWAENLSEEMAVLRDLVDRFPYIAMVRRSPGTAHWAKDS